LTPPAAAPVGRGDMGVEGIGASVVRKEECACGLRLPSII
jgi:hypothetical protein